MRSSTAASRTVCARRRRKSPTEALAICLLIERQDGERYERAATCGSSYELRADVGEAAGFGGGGVHGYRALEGTFLGGCLFSGRAAGRAAAAAIM